VIREDRVIIVIKEVYKNAPKGMRNFIVYIRDPRATRVGEGRAVPTTSTKVA